MPRACCMPGLPELGLAPVLPFFASSRARGRFAPFFICNNRRVPHISPTFGEMWGATVGRPFKPQKDRPKTATNGLPRGDRFLRAPKNQGQGKMLYDDSTFVCSRPATKTMPKPVRNRRKL